MAPNDAPPPALAHADAHALLIEQLKLVDEARRHVGVLRARTTLPVFGFATALATFLLQREERLAALVGYGVFAGGAYLLNLHYLRVYRRHDHLFARIEDRIAKLRRGRITAARAPFKLYREELREGRRTPLPLLTPDFYAAVLATLAVVVLLGLGAHARFAQPAALCLASASARITLDRALEGAALSAVTPAPAAIAAPGTAPAHAPTPIPTPAPAAGPLKADQAVEHQAERGAGDDAERAGARLTTLQETFEPLGTAGGHRRSFPVALSPQHSAKVAGAPWPRRKPAR